MIKETANRTQVVVSLCRKAKGKEETPAAASREQFEECAILPASSSWCGWLLCLCIQVLLSSVLCMLKLGDDICLNLNWDMGEGCCVSVSKQVSFKHGAFQMWSKLQEVCRAEFLWGGMLQRLHAVWGCFSPEGHPRGMSKLTSGRLIENDSGDKLNGASTRHHADTA